MVYVADWSQRQILMWLENSIHPIKTISCPTSDSLSLFVTTKGDIYVSSTGRVYKCTMNSNIAVPVMYDGQTCVGLFVDIIDNLYCSLTLSNHIVRKPLSSDPTVLTIVAGTGYPGNASHMLQDPRGIFVDTNFDLYVADCGNNRIQLFHSGQYNGTTVAGIQASGTITLDCPTGVVLDADRYMFIVDSENHRIVGSGPNGFQCIVSCFGRGTASSQLSKPVTMAFDSYGNIFVADAWNSRIQKFILSRNSCGTCAISISLVVYSCVFNE